MFVLVPEISPILPPGAHDALMARGISSEIGPKGFYCPAASVEAAKAFLATYDPLPHIAAVKLADAAAARWEAMTGGMTTKAGIPLTTDPTSLSLITSLYAAAASGLPGPFTFKDRDGNAQQVTPQQAIDLFKEVAAFVQSCYDREGAVIAEVKAAKDVTATLAIAAAGFPVNS